MVQLDDAKTGKINAYILQPILISHFIIQCNANPPSCGLCTVNIRVLSFFSRRGGGHFLAGGGASVCGGTKFF